MLSSINSLFPEESDPTEQAYQWQLDSPEHLFFIKEYKIHIWKNISTIVQQMKLFNANQGRAPVFQSNRRTIFLDDDIPQSESSVANILSFVEVAYIAGVHINMDTSEEKVINIHMQDKHIIHFIACAEGLFYTNLDDPSMVTNTINTSVNPYYFLSIVKQNSEFFTDSEVGGARNFDKCRNISTGQ